MELVAWSDLRLLIYRLTCLASSFESLDVAVRSSGLKVMVYLCTAVRHLDQ